MIDESKIIVRDNYLPNDSYEYIKNYFMGNQCYWYYCGNYGGGYPQMEHTFHSEFVGTQRYPNTPMVATMLTRMNIVIGNITLCKPGD